MDTNHYPTLKGRSECKPAKKCLLCVALVGHLRKQDTGFRYEPPFSLPEFAFQTKSEKFQSVVMISVDEVCSFDDSQWDKSLT